MAKSKAKKLRKQLDREGKWNPEVKRSPFVFSDMRTRTTKTKKDHLYQFKHKNHQSHEGNDGSFYFVFSTRYFYQTWIFRTFEFQFSLHPECFYPSQA